jgi:hypothetical protein
MIWKMTLQSSSATGLVLQQCPSDRWSLTPLLPELDLEHDPKAAAVTYIDADCWLTSSVPPPLETVRGQRSRLQDHIPHRLPATAPQPHSRHLLRSVHPLPPRQHRVDDPVLEARALPSGLQQSARSGAPRGSGAPARLARALRPADVRGRLARLDSGSKGHRALLGRVSASAPLPHRAIASLHRPYLADILAIPGLLPKGSMTPRPCPP